MLKYKYGYFQGYFPPRKFLENGGELTDSGLAFCDWYTSMSGKNQYYLLKSSKKIQY